MSTETDLLPLAGTLRALPEHVQGVVQAYASANVARAVALLQAEIEALQAEVDAMREALREARDAIEDWAGYASDYFREKHDLAGDLAKINALLRDQEQGK